MNERQKEIAFEKIFKDIKKLVGSICWKQYNFGDPPVCPECEDCEGRRLKEIQDDDYKIIRKFEGNKSRNGTEIFENLFEIEGQILVKGRNKSKFSTYLISVLRNKIIDKDIRKIKGQYRPYKEIKKRGKCAVVLGRYIWEGMNLKEAHEKIITIDECKKTTFDEAQEIETIIIKKTKKNKNVKIVYNSNLEDHLINKERKGTSTILGEMDVKTVSDLIGENENYTDDPLTRLEEEEEEEERAKSTEKQKKILADYKGKLTAQDKLIFNMHFYKEVKVSRIATAIDQTLYFVKKRIKNMSNDLENLNTEKNISI